MTKIKEKEQVLFPHWPNHIPTWLREFFRDRTYATIHSITEEAEKHYGKFKWSDGFIFMRWLKEDLPEKGVIVVLGNMVFPIKNPNKVPFQGDE